MTPKKILILRLSSIGDILLTSPFIRQVRRAFPKARIEYVVKSSFSDLVRFNPNLDAVFEVKPELGQKGLRELKKIFHKRSYDHIFDLHNNFRTKSLTSGLSKTVIHKDRIKRTLLVYLKKNYYRDILPIPERYLQTGEQAGITDDGKGLELFWPKKIEKKTDRLSREIKLDDGFIALAPGAAHATKRWPADYFKEIIQNISPVFKGKIVLLGSASEQADLNKLIINDRVINLAGKLSLLESASVLKRSKILVTNDSGLMHMASAVEIPAIALFGSTVKEFGFFPYRSNHIVLEDNTVPCRPCSHIGRSTCPKTHFNCMRNLTPERVLRELKKQLTDLNK